MARPEDKASAGLIDGERLVPPQVNGAGETPLGVLGTSEPLLRLRRTQGVWQVPELDTPHAEALLEPWPPGSFLVTGQDPNQVLLLRTGTSSGEVRTYQIQKLPGGVSLGYSNLCMPDLPHLLAFLSASRDVLPRTLLLPPPTLRPGDQQRGLPQTGSVQLNITEKVLSVVNKLYLETHRGWGLEQITPETPPETAERQSSAPRNPAPHRVSWVEGPLSPEVCHPGPTLASLEEEEKEDEEEDGDEDTYKDEEKGPDDVLTRHIRALVRARSSYMGRQLQGLRARLTSDAGGPHRPGDPATELLQDVRHLLTDLQDHLSKDPEVRAVFESRGPGVPRKHEDLGAAVEAALCRAVLAPLKPALWTRLRTLRARELRRLRQRQIALRAEAGPEGQGPAPALRSRIHARLEHLHAACAPRRKVALLLAVCSDVYAGLTQGENQEPLGADAFLPALTEELIWSPHIGETQLDVEFLMELLDPDELRGEAGYYLTTWFGALHHIAHYQPEAGRAPQGLSSEARASLRQWHSRRTLHRPDRQDPGAQVQLPFEEPWARDTVPETSYDKGSQHPPAPQA